MHNPILSKTYDVYKTEKYLKSYKAIDVKHALSQYLKEFHGIHFTHPDANKYLKGVRVVLNDNLRSKFLR